MLLFETALARASYFQINIVSFETALAPAGSFQINTRIAAPMSPYALLGPAGSGKTTVLDMCIKRYVKRGGRVLIALPTGMLA